VLEQLGRADASITDLAARFHLTLTGMKKHREGGTRADLSARPAALDQEAAWIERYRQLWAARFNALDTGVEELKRREQGRGRGTEK
jgi:hypothetical protein